MATIYLIKEAPMILTFFRTLALSLLLAGCSSKATTPKQILHLNIYEDADSLDPRQVRRVKDLTLVRHLFEGLTRLDENGTPTLALASAVEISDDGLTYTFFLRDAQWTNGERVTAEDFVYSWQSVLNPLFPTEYAHMLYAIKNGKRVHTKGYPSDQLGVKALDAHILQVKLERPTPYFLELVAFPTFFAVNHNCDQNFPNWTHPPGKHFVCNGPFRLERWQPDQEISLKKNESYWDASSVFLSKLEFSIISDNNTESLLFSRGELDWLGQPLSHNICSELLGKLKEKGELDSYPIAGTFWFKCNVQKEPFNSCKLRQAFSKALNRETIINHILQGSQEPATSPLPPSLSLMGNLDQMEDQNGALQLFEEALGEMGWNRKTLPPIELTYYHSERNTKIVQYVQQVWQDLFDVPIHLKQMEYQLCRQKSQLGEYQIATGEWIADFLDPLSFL
ncbi:MAG: peptide ABC transporter substrate-binding protein, partial [Chlamydiae bacterium]|nr:peptide ABC transporter substrate-binding protein [Chlamydiota bacterium]